MHSSRSSHCTGQLADSPIGAYGALATAVMNRENR